MKFTTNTPDPQQMPNKSTSRDNQQPQNQQIINSTMINHNQNQNTNASTTTTTNSSIHSQSPKIKGSVPYDNNHIKDNKQTTSHIQRQHSHNDYIHTSNEEHLEDNKENEYILSNMIVNDMDKDLNDIVNALSLEKEFSDIIITQEKSSQNISNISKSIITNNTKNSKRKKRKKLRKGDKNNGISYNPCGLYRAQGNIQISKQFTGSIIPMTIRENICNIYSYIDKCTAICLNMSDNENQQLNNINDNNIRILNYNFHDKINNDELYCIIQIQDINSNASRGYKWKMINKLYNKKELEFEYGCNKPPKSFRQSVMFKSYLSDQKQIKNILMNQKSIQGLIDNTPWHKTDIFNKVNNKRRMHLFLTKPEFMKQFRDFISCSTSSENEINLIPILMFNDNDFNEFWIEHVWIITIDDNINIGISLKYNNKIGIKVSGIHLDGEYLIGQHELVLPNHNCNCFNNFKSNINYLSIGNPDDSLNKIKYYKQQIDELTKYKLELQTLQKQIILQNNTQIMHKPQIKRSKSDNINKHNNTFNNNNTHNSFNTPRNININAPLNIQTTSMHTPQRYNNYNNYTNTPHSNTTPQSHSQMYHTLNSPSNISFNSSYGGNINNCITPNYNRNMNNININNNTYNK